MMAEYGRIHTDGSRSGGQPIPSEDCPKCERFGDDCGEHSPSWQELAAYWKAEAERLRQPTQSNIFDACDVQKHTLIVEQDYASHTVKVKSLNDSQPTQGDVNERLGAWLSAALDDPNCSEAFKQDINDWFASQPTQSDIEQADIDAAESIFWVETTIDDHEAVAKTFARHRQYGYDQGYYDGQRDRQPTQEKSK